MNDQERYEDAARRLAGCGYATSLDGTTYIVRHLTDHDDVSRMRDLNELAELADLFEWREEWKTSQSLANGTSAYRNAAPYCGETKNEDRC